MSLGSNEKGGVALWLLLAFLGAITWLPLLFEYISHTASEGQRDIYNLQAQYVTESGLNWGLSYCAQNGVPNTTETKLPILSNISSLNLKVKIIPRETTKAEIISIVSGRALHIERHLRIVCDDKNGQNIIVIEEVW